MIPEANTQISKFTDLQDLPLEFAQVPSCWMQLFVIIYLSSLSIYLHWSEEFVDCVSKSLYVDDFVGGEGSDDLVFEMCKNLKSSFKTGGFN